MAVYRDGSIHFGLLFPFRATIKPSGTDDGDREHAEWMRDVFIDYSGLDEAQLFHYEVILPSPIRLLDSDGQVIYSAPGGALHHHPGRPPAFANEPVIVQVSFFLFFFVLFLR